MSGADANPTVPDLTCGGFPAPYTIVQGPSTIMWTYNTSRNTFLEDNPSVTYVQNINMVQSELTYYLPSPHSGDCVLAGTTKAVCTIIDGTQTLPETTYHSNEIAYTPFAVAAGAVAATSTPISASMTEHTKKEANSTLSHAGTDSGAVSTTRAPSAMSGSSRLQVFHTGSIPGISSVKTSASTGAPPKSTNMGVQRSSSRTDGVFGALVIALAGAIL